MLTNEKPVVLIAPLDWGLGHATRCIPIINLLLNSDYEVVIAAEGAQKKLLENEFPHVKIVDLHGYRLKYGATKWRTILNIFFQVPKILSAIKKEKKWLKKYTSENPVNLIISDNRYGFRFPHIPSFFITHQLCIKTPFGKWNEWLLQKINYGYIKKFSACWVPDYNTNENLAGELSHPKKMPQLPVHYIGHLSRMKKEKVLTSCPLLILISGPEPQRSLFENIIVNELLCTEQHAVIVRGLPGTTAALNVPGYLKVYNHLPANQLNELINAAEIIISRPGYSTVMDLLPLQKKCVFIPTPGQTEQEYLADYLSKKNMCISVSQRNFNLQSVLQQLEKTEIKTISFPESFYEEEIKRCLIEWRVES